MKQNWKSNPEENLENNEINLWIKSDVVQYFMYFHSIQIEPNI